jgi:hypothetical protein
MAAKESTTSRPSDRPTVNPQTQYRPDRPGPHDQPPSGEPGDEVSPPADLINEQEASEAAIEHGRMTTTGHSLSSVKPPFPEYAAPERPPNPALKQAEPKRH